MKTYICAVLDRHERHTLQRVEGLVGAGEIIEGTEDRDALKALRACMSSETRESYFLASRGLRQVRKRLAGEDAEFWSQFGAHVAAHADDLARMRVQHISMLDEALVVLDEAIARTTKRTTEDDEEEAT